MFTDRYIRVPVDLYDKKEADMIGYKEETKTESTVMCILPFEISHFRPSENDNEEMVHTLIYMKNGEAFHTTLNIEEFEKLLNKIT